MAEVEEEEVDRPDVGLTIRTGTGKDQGRGQRTVAGALAYLLRGTTLEEVVGAASISMAAALEAAAVVVVTIQQADRRPDQVSSAWNSAVSLSLPRCSVFVSRPQSFRVLCLPVAASRRRRKCSCKTLYGSTRGSSSSRSATDTQQATGG